MSTTTETSPVSFSEYDTPTSSSSSKSNKGYIQRSITEALNSGPSLPTGNIELPMSEFFARSGTDVVVDREGRKKTLEKKTAITPEMQTQFESFARNQFDRINRLFTTPDPRNPGRMLSDVIRDNDEFQDLRNFFEMVASERLNENREVIRGQYQFNETKFREMLKTTDGIMAIKNLMEERLMDDFAMLGFAVRTNPEGNRDNVAQGTRITNGKGQGVLNRVRVGFGRWWNQDVTMGDSGRRTPENETQGERILRVGSEGVVIAAAAASGTVLGAMTGGTPEGALIGGGLPIAAAVATRIVESWNNYGVNLEQYASNNALRLIQGDNPAAGSSDRAAIMYATTQINPMNFAINGNRVEYARGRYGNNLGETTANPEALSAEARGILDNLQTLYKEGLHIPKELLDANPEQTILQNIAGQRRFQQLGANWEQDIQNQLRTNGIDINAIADQTEAEREYMRARRQVTAEYFRRLIQSDPRFSRIEIFSAFNIGRDTEVINQKIKDRREGDVELNRRTEAQAKRIAELNDEKNKLQPTFEKLKNRDEERKKIDEISEEIGEEFPETQAPGRTIDSVLTDMRADLDTLPHPLPPRPTTRRRGGPRPPRTPSSFEIRRVELHEDARTEKDKRKEKMEQDYANAAKYPNGRPKYADRDITEALAEIDRRYAELERQLNERKEEAKARLKILDDLNKKLNIAEKEQKKSAREVAGTATENVSEIVADFDAINAYIPQANLENLTFEELLTEVNNRYTTTGGAEGWPSAENNNPDNRRRLINAITEAKAQTAENNDKSRARINRVTAYTGVVREEPLVGPLPGGLTPLTRITDEQLTKLRPNELQMLINNMHTADQAAANAGIIPQANVRGWSYGDNATRARDLNLAIDEANRRLALRHEISVRERMADLEKQIEDEEKAKESLRPTLEQEAERLELTKDILQQQQEILGRATRVMATPDTQRQLTNNAPIAGNTYSEAERNFRFMQTPGGGGVAVATQPPEGYFTLLQILTDYQNKKNREQEFRKITRVLTPEKVTALFTEAIPGIAPANIEFLINILDTRINTTGEMGRLELRETLLNVNSILKDEALAI